MLSGQRFDGGPQRVLRVDEFRPGRSDPLRSFRGGLLRAGGHRCRVLLLGLVPLICRRSVLRRDERLRRVLVDLICAGHGQAPQRFLVLQGNQGLHFCPGNRARERKYPGVRQEQQLFRSPPGIHAADDVIVRRHDLRPVHEGVVAEFFVILHVLQQQKRVVNLSVPERQCRQDGEADVFTGSVLRATGQRVQVLFCQVVAGERTGRGVADRRCRGLGGVAVSRCGGLLTLARGRWCRRFGRRYAGLAGCACFGGLIGRRCGHGRVNLLEGISRILFLYALAVVAEPVPEPVSS